MVESLGVPVVGPLLSGSVLPLLPLFGCLLLAVRHVLDSQPTARLVVAMGSPLDVLQWTQETD